MHFDARHAFVRKDTKKRILSIYIFLRNWKADWAALKVCHNFRSVNQAEKTRLSASIRFREL